MEADSHTLITHTLTPVALAKDEAYKMARLRARYKAMTSLRLKETSKSPAASDDEISVDILFRRCGS